MANLTVYLVTGKRFPDQNDHDKAEDDRNQFIAELRADQRFGQVQFQPWAWDRPTVDLDVVDAPRLMLVGYSFGGNTVLNWSQQAHKRFVDQLVLLDPVNPANYLLGFPPFDIPPTVRKADCYVRSGFHIPWPASRKI